MLEIIMNKMLKYIREIVDEWSYPVGYMLLLFIFSYASILNAALSEELSFKDVYFNNQNLWFSSIVNFGLLFMLLLDCYGKSKSIVSKEFTYGLVLGCFLIITLRELVNLHITGECSNYIAPIDKVWFVYIIHLLFCCCLIFLKKEAMTSEKDKVQVIRVH